MSKRMDPDVKALRTADCAMMATTPSMRQATLEYLWDKYLKRAPAWLAEHDRKTHQEKP